MKNLSSLLDVRYLRSITLQSKTTPEGKTTTDPGRALITGLVNDVGRMKGPILRGLASRAPYFHNGTQTLGDVAAFYSTRFATGLSQPEQQDLVDFLSSSYVSLIAGRKPYQQKPEPTSRWG